MSAWGAAARQEPTPPRPLPAALQERAPPQGPFDPAFHQASGSGLVRSHSMPASPEAASLPRWAEQLPTAVAQSGAPLALRSHAPLTAAGTWSRSQCDLGACSADGSRVTETLARQAGSCSRKLNSPRPLTASRALFTIFVTGLPHTGDGPVHSWQRERFLIRPNEPRSIAGGPLVSLARRRARRSRARPRRWGGPRQRLGGRREVAGARGAGRRRRA